MTVRFVSSRIVLLTPLSARTWTADAGKVSTRGIDSDRSVESEEHP